MEQDVVAPEGYSSLNFKNVNVFHKKGNLFHEGNATQTLSCWKAGWKNEIVVGSAMQANGRSD